VLGSSSTVGTIAAQIGFALIKESSLVVVSWLEGHFVEGQAVVRRCDVHSVETHPDLRDS